MINKRWNTVWAAAAAFGLLTACSSGGAGTGAPTQPGAAPAASSEAKDPVTLQWLVFENVGFTADLYKTIIAAFEQSHPGVKIEKRLFQGDDRGKYLQTLIATGQIPDVVLDGGQLAQMKLLLPLSDGITSLVKDSALIRFNDGKVYYVPTDEQIKMGVYYNKKIFADQGVTVPKTWDEFMKLCETLKSKGVAPIVGGQTDRPWLPGALAQPMLMTELYASNDKWTADMLSGKLKWNSPVVADTLGRWKDVVDRGYYHPGSPQFSYAQHTEEFKKGGGAMLINGGWFAGDLDTNNPNLDIGWFPVPLKDGGNYYLANLGNTLAISAKTKYPEQAQQFVEFFLTNKEMYGKWLKADAGFAVTKQPVSYEMQKTLAAVAEGIKPLKPVIEWDENKGDLSSPNGFFSFYNKSLQELYFGKKADIPKTLDKWDAEMQRLLQAQKK